MSTGPARSPARPWALAALVAGLLVYAPTVRHAFAFDDDVVIVRNRLVRSLDAFPALVRGTEWAGSGLAVVAYRPVTDATYALNHAVSGLAPWSYHLVNALLHGVVAALVVLVAARLGIAPAAAGLGGLLFAVHPIHVEAVANVVGRKDVLATAFLLAMVLAHRTATRRGGPALVLAPAAYAAAMLSKEVGAVGIALVGIVDALAPDASPEPGQSATPTWRRRAALYAAHTVALGAYLALYRAVVAGIPDSTPFEDNPAASASTVTRVLTAVAVAGKGLCLQLLPVDQSPDYSFDAIPVVRSLGDPRLLAAIALFVGWAVAGGWFWRRRGAPLVLGTLGWYLVALLPASNLLFPVGTIFGERLVYLPSVATALLAGVALHAVARRLPRGAAIGAGLALAAALAGGTLRYGSVWATELELFDHAARVVPRSSKVQHKLAVLRLAAGDPAGALAAADRAAAIRPGNAGIEVVRAEVYRALGRPDDEAAALARALAANPDEPDALYAEGRRAQEAGRLEEAARCWQRAVTLRPRQAGALADLSTLALVRGDAQSALSLALRAVEANERQASAWYNLGLMHRARGDAAGARDAFTRFVECAGPEYAAEAAAVREQLARGALR